MMMPIQKKKNDPAQRYGKDQVKKEKRTPKPKDTEPFRQTLLMANDQVDTSLE